MRIHLNCASYNRTHAFIAVYMNGANCGQLTLYHNEALALRDTLVRDMVQPPSKGLHFSNVQITGHWPED
jgi:hypothetical protein